MAGTLFAFFFSGRNLEQAHNIKQRYYERALRKWKNTTNFAEGYSIPALKDVKAPRLWKDKETKKFYGGEDWQEWADNNHPVSNLLFLILARE